MKRLRWYDFAAGANFRDGCPACRAAHRRPGARPDGVSEHVRQRKPQGAQQVRWDAGGALRSPIISHLLALIRDEWSNRRTIVVNIMKITQHSDCTIGALNDLHTASAHVVGCDGSSNITQAPRTSLRGSLTCAQLNATTYRYSFNCDFPDCSSCLDHEDLTLGACGAVLLTSTLCLGGLGPAAPSYFRPNLIDGRPRGGARAELRADGSWMRHDGGCSGGEPGQFVRLPALQRRHVRPGLLQPIPSHPVPSHSQVLDNGSGSYDVRLQCLVAAGQCVQCGYENTNVALDTCYSLDSDDDGFDVSFLLVRVAACGGAALTAGADGYGRAVVVPRRRVARAWRESALCMSEAFIRACAAGDHAQLAFIADLAKGLDVNQYDPVRSPAGRAAESIAIMRGPARMVTFMLNLTTIFLVLRGA